MTCKLLLLLAPGALLAQESVWRNVAARPYTPVRPETVRLSRSRLSAIGKLFQYRQQNSLPWDCDFHSWLDEVRVSRMPVARREVLLIEQGGGCGSGAPNGPMWLLDWEGGKPRLIATPDGGFQGWLFSVEPTSHHGLRDVVAGWHESAFETGLTYLRFDGDSYRQVSSAMLYSDDDVGQQRMAEARKGCEAAHKRCILLVRNVW
jgi:hypothetical protein